MFPAGYLYDTQLVCNLLAVDGMNDPDVLAINAASAALCLSDIPFNGPVGACRVAFVDGEPIPHPTRKQMAKSSLDLVVSGVRNNEIIMLEANADNLSYENFMKAARIGVNEVTQIIKTVEEFAQVHGKPKRAVEKFFVPPEDVISAAESLSRDQILAVMSDFTHDKLSRDKALSAVREETVTKLGVRNRSVILHLS